MKASTSVGLRALLASLALVIGLGTGPTPANAARFDAKPRAGTSTATATPPGPVRPAGSASTTTAAGAQAAPQSYESTTERVHLRDLGIVVGTMTDVDRGPSPPLGAIRTIERTEIVHALEAAKLRAPSKLPERVTITRKRRLLSQADVDRLVRSAIGPARMPNGAKLGAVRGVSVEVPEGFDKVTAELPALAGRTGTVPAIAQLSFWLDGAVIARIQVPLEFVVPSEALDLRGELVVRGAADEAAPTAESSFVARNGAFPKSSAARGGLALVLGSLTLLSLVGLVFAVRKWASTRAPLELLPTVPAKGKAETTSDASHDDNHHDRNV